MSLRLALRGTCFASTLPKEPPWDVRYVKPTPKVQGSIVDSRDRPDIRLQLRILRLALAIQTCPLEATDHPAAVSLWEHSHSPDTLPSSSLLPAGSYEHHPSPQASAEARYNITNPSILFIQSGRRRQDTLASYGPFA